MTKDAKGPQLDVIGENYVVNRELGRGGMATVYLCTDRRDQSLVAVKILRQELGSTVVIERFLREIAYASELDHPRIPKVLDSGVIGNLPYYVMTFIDGESLRARLDREKQLPIPDAMRIAYDVIGPAEYAHQRGIIHRDLKPENILLTADGGVYVLDFGIARAIIESGVDRLTSTGVGVGTPAYMSPEQALGDRNVDARSDVYSMGCVLYEMIAGIPPFVGPTSQVVISRRFASAPPPLSEMRDGVPDSLEAALAQALARAPADRWLSMGAFGDALRAAATGQTGAGRRRRARRWIRSHSRAMGALAIGLAAVAGIGTAVAARSGRGRDADVVTPRRDPRHIAVLYFEDASADHSLGYLATGLTESLIDELTHVPAIHVISRNGVKAFKESADPADRAIAALPHVGSVVEGSVQRSGNRIRVTARLIDGETNRSLTSDRIVRPMGELFLLEDDLANAVSKMLRQRIGQEVRARETIAGTKSVRAQELMFRADEARNEAEAAATGRDTVLLNTADSLFAGAERADAKWIEPVIARGWVALEKALRQSDASRTRAFQQATDYSAEAIRKLPRSPPAELQLRRAAVLELRGTTSYYRAVRQSMDDVAFKNLLRNAEVDLISAVSLDSTLATAWGTLSRTRVALGEMATAEKNARTAFAMDAYLRDAQDVLLTLYIATLMRDSLSASWRWCEQGARDYPRDPRFVECRLTLLAEDRRRAPNPRLAWSLVAEGNRLDPLPHAKRAGRPLLPFYRQMLAAIVSARAGDRHRALAVATSVRANVVNDPDFSADLKNELSLDLDYEHAYLHLVLGDKPEAMRIIGRYVKARPTLSRLVAQAPRWKPLREDPAFKKWFDELR